MKYVTEKTSYGEKITCIPETEEEKNEFKKLARERELYWCKCKEDNGSYFVPDGKSKICEKHHYLCRKCDKITQIG